MRAVCARRALLCHEAQGHAPGGYSALGQGVSPFLFPKAVSVPVPCPLLCTWAARSCGHTGQDLGSTEHGGGRVHTGPPRVREGSHSRAKAWQLKVIPPLLLQCTFMQY